MTLQGVVPHAGCARCRTRPGGTSSIGSVGAAPVRPAVVPRCGQAPAGTVGDATEGRFPAR
ncbi:hypothetical protein FTX61_09630 [Nitriliruptoraceae bacterium ZYF776]|nr:hypothetical protein [Profundirhabdus halotolerans]